MKLLRKILYPFSVLYGEIVTVRNKLYDKGVLKSTRFDTPIIVVGNLSVGGTGKSPQIEYLIRLLKNDYKIAALSRGYKRESKGFIIADATTTVRQIGDEPMQFYNKFKNIIIAVDADRVNGIEKLNQLHKPDIILLDDAFQHRKVTAGFNILLTPYDNLYVDDAMLPTGDLREKVSGANRAQVIIVTKCPEHLSEQAQFEIANKLNPEMHQTVFFSKIAYAETIKQNNNTVKIDDLHNYEVLLLTGIAKTKPLCNFLESKKVKYQHLKYADHHQFTEKELNTINNTFHKMESDKKLILTTEKDYIRTFDTSHKNVYYLPIETLFLEHQNDFNTLIKKYVEQSTRNS